jgi:hypothetical protein
MAVFMGGLSVGEGVDDDPILIEAADTKYLLILFLNRPGATHCGERGPVRTFGRARSTRSNRCGLES